MVKNCISSSCKKHFYSADGTKRSFFELPKQHKDLQRRIQWLSAIPHDVLKEGQWSPPNSRTICSDHFVTGRPSSNPLHPDFTPCVFSERDRNIATQKLQRYKRSQRRSSRFRVTQECTPPPRPPSPPPSPPPPPPPLLPGSQPNDPDSQDTVSVDEDDHLPSSPHSSPEKVEEEPIAETVESMKKRLDEQIALNNSMLKYIGHLQEERDQAKQRVEELMTARFSVSICREDDSRCQFYTGLSWDVFLETFHFVSDHVQGKTKSSLPFIDQFFLSLVKLRLDLPFELIANLTGCGESTISDYFWKWVDVLYAKLKFLVRQPDREAIIMTLPPEFKVKFPRLTTIIDCFEIFIDMPGELLARQQTYSNYKKHTTVKVLIACSPLGAITFLSLAWGGRVSDVELVRKSGFISPHRHQPGDQILADRGFPLQDDFAVQCSAELIIPSFTKGKPQLSSEDVETSREKSSIRIHVERVIGLLKKRYTILKGTLPIQMVKSLKDEAENADLASIDRLLTVCAALVNLGSSIVFKG